MSRWRRLADSVRWWFGLLAALWWAGAVAVAAVRWIRPATAVPWTALTYAWVTATMSAVAAVLYASDKRRAVRERRRIPERVLHATSLLGGWPGAYLAQQTLRHKTQKTSFRLMFWSIVVLHLAAIGYCAYHWLTYAPASKAASKRATQPESHGTNTENLGGARHSPPALTRCSPARPALPAGSACRCC